jgi:meso-butanediol dehydrogenase / (S,S)-butanediol dehydrogenase / diacetyl reductase
VTKSVLVTGGGTGIGAAVARLLTGDGWRVAILGRRASALRQVAAQTGALDVAGDVSVSADVSKAIALVTERFGGLDGLVLNAGVMAPGGVGALSEDDWASMLAVNLTGPFLVARAALPFLLRSGHGRVVSVASVAALRAAADMGGYAATKAGLVMLTQSLAVDHAREGLRANVVCPGWTITEMADSEMAAFGSPRGRSVAEAYADVTALVPARRAALADEVAAAVGWLMSDAASYVNGTVIPVDGGATVVDVGTVPFDFLITQRGDV